jgi:purine-binding chemotaxis protein CheW
VTDPREPRPDPESDIGLGLERADTLAVVTSEVEFGLPLERVRTVIRVPPITRLPFPPSAVLGVASVRGTIVPVLDLGERLLGRAGRRDGRLVVVEETGSGQQMGLLVDRVSTLLGSGPAAHDAPPEEIEASLPAGWVRGVLSAGTDRLVTLLDLDRVLALGTPTDKEQR